MKSSTVEAQTIAYHSILNPVIWSGMDLKDDVRAALLKVADQFTSTWGFDIAVKDVVLTGSNCSYNWNAYSDLDLHIIADMSAVGSAHKSFVTEYLKIKKQLWNQNHKIKVKGYIVEVYAQDSKELLIASGVFSLTDNKWVKKPSRSVPPKPNAMAVKAKVNDFTEQIDTAIKQGNELSMMAIVQRLSDLRKSGLQTKGEFSTENLTFKTLRNTGAIARLRAAIEDTTDRKLTLEAVSHRGPKAKPFKAKKKKYVSKHKGPSSKEGGLSSADRWKKRRVAKMWAWKRSRFSRLGREKPASQKGIEHRTYTAARRLTYKDILGKVKKSSLPYGARRRVEKTAARVYKINVRNPESRNTYKYRRRDTSKRSGVSYKTP